MQRESNWRYWLTLIVLALCLIFIMPTMRYAWFIATNAEPQQQEFQTLEAYREALASYDAQKSALQREAISLGLDLIGGVDVMLSVDRSSVESFRLRARGDDLATRLREAQISHSMSISDEGNILTLKLDDTEQARQAANILKDNAIARYFRGFDENILRQTGAVQLVLREDYVNQEMRDALSLAENKIRDRVDAFGLTQPSISLQEETNSILVQIPGERDPEAAINELIRPAQLEFYPLYTIPSESQGNNAHDELVMDLFEPKAVVTTDDSGRERYEWKMKEGKSLPDDRHQVLFARDLAPEEIRTNPWLVSSPIASNGSQVQRNVFIVTKDPAMTGEDLRDAWVQTNTTDLRNPIMVSLSFGQQGAADFYKMSSDYLLKSVGIALDKKIYSDPVFQGKIPSGRAQITGNFDQLEAQRLAMVLKAGALPTTLQNTASRQIGPSLGEESILQSSRALLIGAACVTIFMVAYYGMAGVVSILALILNILVILGCLDMFNATLTLSGIGGMILTLGMAVDANVLIYERIREELDSGTDLANAIRSGFGQAFSVILDSNLTTLLAAFVLLQFGQGSVQGFALTMAFGLLANLFTGLTVTYALCRLWFNMTGHLSLGKLRIFRNPNFNFIGARKVSFILSAVMVVGSLSFLVLRGGPDMAVDFQGGLLTELEVNVEGDQTGAIRESFSVAGLTDQAKVQSIRTDAGNRYLVRISLQDAPAGTELGDLEYTKDLVQEKMQGQFGENFSILDQRAVSKEVGQTFQSIAILVVIAASICILLYLWFRFELVFGAAAVVALVHDLIITLGVITLLRVQISLDIVSALLILLGFSVNDTIVIFDRVRENSHSMFGHTFKDVCNRAMNQCLSRTVITSFTTVGVMLIMYFFGGRSLAPFALTLIVGGIVGTYSSDFVATPLVYWYNKRQEGKLQEHLGRKGQAAAQKSDKPTAPKPATAMAGGSSARGTASNRGRR